MQHRKVRPAATTAALLLPVAVLAQDLGFSPDITAEFGSGPSTLLADEDVGIDDGVGGVTGPIFAPGLIPSGVGLSAWHDASGGDSYAAFDTTVALPGLPAGSSAEPRDVLRYDHVSHAFSSVFDGSAQGVPSGARVDAVSVDGSGDLLLSFDTTLALPGPVSAADEDVVRFSGGSFSMFFDGSVAGVDPSTDLDAAHLMDGGAILLMSFDTSGSAGGVDYDDEDVLEYDMGSGSFALFQDSSITDPADWPAADLVALPEPAAGLGELAAVALLGMLALRRAPGSPSRRAIRSSASLPCAGSCRD